MKYFLFDHKCRKKGIYPRTFKGIISKKNGLLQAHFFNPYTIQLRESANRNLSNEKFGK